MARRVAVYVPGAAFEDPAPTETERRGVELVGPNDTSAVAFVGWSSAAWDALELARRRAASVERLVLAAVPRPDADVAWLDDVRAKTLLLYGSADPATGSAHGRWWQRRLPSARLEMVPGGGHDLLVPMWPRILSFVAPTR